MAYSELSSFEEMMDCGIISNEEFEIVQSIQMKGRKEEIKQLFKKHGCLDLYKFITCPSDGRLKLRIPAILRREYNLRQDYKFKTEKEIIDAVYSDLHQLRLQKLTLDDVFDRWKPVRVKKILQRGRSMHTAEKNFEVYEALVRGTSLGTKAFRDIRYPDFDEFFCICEGKHITKSRANEVKTTLNFIWEYGKSIGLVDINYSKEFYLTDYDFVPPKLKPLKNPTERDRLIEFYLSLDTVYGYACALMECLNLRISEIKALKWSDIYMEDGYILVAHMVDHSGEYREYTKNHATEGTHFVQLSPRAIQILKLIREKNYCFRDDFVFLGKNDNFILTGECNENIHRACKALGIEKNFTTHDCRRYAATQSALAGMSTPALQMAFGWKDRDTAEKYVQVAAATMEHQKVLVDVLN